MDKEQVLEFIKKNAFALSCGVVALLAVGLWYYPLGGYVQELTEKATSAAGAYGTVNGYFKPRTLPKLDPTKTADVPLISFPTPQQVKLGQDAITKMTAQAQATVDYLVALNDDKVHPPRTEPVHPLLIPGLLPKPPQGQEVLRIYFADTYRNALSTSPTMSGLGKAGNVPAPVQANPANPDPMLVDDRLGANKARNLYNDVLRAGMPPDQKLIDARKAWLWESQYAQRIVKVNGQPTNRPEIDQQFAQEARLVPDQLASEISRTRNVYLDKDAFSLYQAFLPTNPGSPRLSDFWYAQMSFWLQQDVAVAVANLNAESTNGVADSPVKRILKFELASQTAIYRNPPGTGGGNGGGLPGTNDETAKLDLSYAVSPSGRTSNKFYDVVPFSLLIDVDATKVNQVLAGLTRDRLIYINSQSLYAVDAASLAPAGFLYGTVPVVRLSLTGEELFLRSWTVPLMPQDIKVQLGLEQPVAGQTAGEGGGMTGMPGMPQP